MPRAKISKFPSGQPQAAALLLAIRPFDFFIIRIQKKSNIVIYMQWIALSREEPT
jgi:hypothetical protein